MTSAKRGTSFPQSRSFLCVYTHYFSILRESINPALSCVFLHSLHLRSNAQESRKWEKEGEIISILQQFHLLVQKFIATPFEIKLFITRTNSPSGQLDQLHKTVGNRRAQEWHCNLKKLIIIFPGDTRETP